MTRTRAWTPSVADPELSALSRTERLLVALDFDGTLAPLVLEPMAARAVPEAVEAVRRLSALPRTTVAYVSGRSLVHLREIAEHTDRSPIALAGSHGAEFWFPGEGIAEPIESPEVRALREALFAEIETLLRDYPDVHLERKTLGIGVHGRRAQAATEAIAFAAVDDLMARRAPGWRRRHGDRILEYSSVSAGKDAAIARLRSRYRPTAVLFVGDDVTDEDALGSLTSADLGVRVGEGETSARLRVRTPHDVAALLEVIATERGSARE